MKDIKSLFTTHYRLPKVDVLERVLKNLSPMERLLSAVFIVLLVIGATHLLYNVNALFLTEIPARGGELREGIVGSPRFLNPLLSLSDADRDLSALIYSGLLRATPGGELIPDLASRYEMSEDGLSYTFHLREDATFHDGTRVTADDVLFTIQKAQDSGLKSPKRANWEGVMVEKKDALTLTLTLKQPYASFLENATLGILPKHVWKDADAEQFPFSPFNLEAVGSGPYKVTRIKRNDSGIPNYFEFTAFRKYALGAPYILRITVHFYPNEKDLLDGLSRGEVESINTITPQSAKLLEEKGLRIERTPLPRVFGVFFNQNQATLLAEKPIRQALLLATDKDTIVNTVLSGYGVPIEDPVPPFLLTHTDTEATTTEARLAMGNAILDKAKWIRNAETGIRERKKGKEAQKLSFSLVTSDVPELRESAELIKEMWGKLGAEVRLQIFESGDLNQNVIRPRRFDALLFGEIIGRDLDLFAFWHSSQRNDPGLNIAMYTNSKVDKLLEEARRTTDPEKRTKDYLTAVETISSDLPAIFLYSPEFIYILPEKVQGFKAGRTTVPSERFLDIQKWYISTEKVWNVFSKK
ncbi:MAG: peptide ABC transporter substrate-binding protein [Candidatus Taylorbacteria bacterium]|nr:peptide ABC transporter substrate-binding protein [Candidatus Taylorbacteria bacterium]